MHIYYCRTDIFVEHRQFAPKFGKKIFACRILTIYNKKKIGPEKYPAYNSSSKTSLLQATNMKISLRSVLCMALVVLVSACGGQPATDASIKTAAAMQVVIATPAPGSSTQAVSAQAAKVQGPTPDCAPENCQGLRIIDGNAEAYRIDAQRRAAAEANGDAPQV